MRTRVRMYARTYVRKCTYVRMYVCTYVLCMYCVRMYVRTYVRMYCTYVRMYVCTYVRTVLKKTLLERNASKPPAAVRSLLIIPIHKISNQVSQIPEPLHILTSKCPLKVQISKGLGPFLQIELLKTGSSDPEYCDPNQVYVLRPRCT